MTVFKKNFNLKFPYLILCEGRDEKEFLIRYLNSEELKTHPFLANDVDVEDFGGNEGLPWYLLSIQEIQGFSDLRAILIIRDAETSAVDAERQIQGALRSAGLPVPDRAHKWARCQDGTLKVGYLLFPTCNVATANGTLEDLCIQILRDPQAGLIVSDIDAFLQELRVKRNRSFPHLFKTRLHTFFSVTDNLVSLKIGEAAKANAFDWTCGCLTPLKQFLVEMAQQI